MDMNWRTVQFFLSDDGVAEVMVETEDSKKVKCTCAEFSKSAKCKHSRAVRNSMMLNNGHFKIQIPDGIPDEVVFEAMESAETFREFILMYGKIEVI
jgi:hypothetical protein